MHRKILKTSCAFALLLLATNVGNSVENGMHIHDDAVLEVLKPWEDNPTTSFLLLDDNSIIGNIPHKGGISIDASLIIDYAKQFLGKPYRSGAKGPYAFDCSGFTSFVYKNFDISLSPSSSTQYTQGEQINTADIRPGDLLFFSGRRKKSVGHVAMAVDVDDKGTVTFIHAATKGGIRYDSYPDGGYYSQRYIGARRVLE